MTKRVVVFCGLYSGTEIVPFEQMGYESVCFDSGDPYLQLSETDRVIAENKPVVILTNSLIVLRELNVLIQRFLRESNKVSLNPDDVEARLMLSVGSEDLLLKSADDACINTDFINYWLDKQNKEWTELHSKELSQNNL